jgi:hypothetical protein
MLALTEQAPWGTAIIHFLKFIENRTWAPPDSLIGKRFAIHQGKTLDDDALTVLQFELCTDFPVKSDIPLGVFLGTVKLQGYVHVSNGSAEWHGCEPLRAGALARIMRSSWRNETASHLWCLKEPRALKTPIPCRGLQKLWHVPAEHVRALEAL